MTRMVGGEGTPGEGVPAPAGPGPARPREGREGADASGRKADDARSPRGSPTGGGGAGGASPGIVRLAMGRDASCSATWNRLKHHARRGFPDVVRPQAWVILAQVDLILMDRPGDYADLCRRALDRGGAAKGDDEKKSGEAPIFPPGEDTDDTSTLTVDADGLNVLEQIERDVHRTFPKQHLFCKEGGGGEGKEGDGSVGCDDPEDFIPGDPGECLRSASSGSRSSASGRSSDAGTGQDALRRILGAYSVYDPAVGYCQGMNFIAAMFMTFLTEEESFWLLTVVMNEEPYLLRDLFGEDMARTREVLYIAEKLVAQFLPRLARHLAVEGVHASMFMTQWLITVFTSTFPFDLVARVWDSFLTEGWKIVYRIILSLLKHASKDLLERNFEDILTYLRELPSEVDGRVIFKESLLIALKGKHIQGHVNEWRKQLARAGDGGSSGPGPGPSKQWSLEWGYARLPSIGSASTNSSADDTPSASVSSPVHNVGWLGQGPSRDIKRPKNDAVSEVAAAPGPVRPSVGSTSSANSVADETFSVSVNWGPGDDMVSEGTAPQDLAQPSIGSVSANSSADGTPSASVSYPVHNFGWLGQGPSKGAGSDTISERSSQRSSRGGSRRTSRGGSVGRERAPPKIPRVRLPDVLSPSQLVAMRTARRHDLGPRPIEVYDLSESLLPIVGAMKFAVLLHNVLTPAECSALIERAEDTGFEDASIVVDEKTGHKRDCTHFVMEDSGLAGKWYQRVVNALKGTYCHKKLMNASWMVKPIMDCDKECTDEEIVKYNAVGMNDCLRLQRYKKWQFLSPHVDSSVAWGASEGDCAGQGAVEGTGETSLATVHVYLNHKFKGGLTTFRDKNRYLDVKPQTGSVLVFEHGLPYESKKVIQGRKYLVRSEIMYSMTSDAPEAD